MTSPTQLVLSKLPDAKPTPNGWQARCPAHDDKQPSLSIAQGDDGRALLNCHANCPTTDIVAALNLTMTQLMPPQQPHTTTHTMQPPKTKTPSDASGGGMDWQQCACGDEALFPDDRGTLS